MYMQGNDAESARWGDKSLEVYVLARATEENDENGPMEVQEFIDEQVKSPYRCQASYTEEFPESTYK